MYMEKRCSKCKATKDSSNYSIKHGTVDGLNSVCRVCVSEYNKEYNKRNTILIAKKRKEKYEQLKQDEEYMTNKREKKRIYMLNNPDKVKNWKKQDYIRNKESYVARAANRYTNNRDRILQVLKTRYNTDVVYKETKKQYIYNWRAKNTVKVIKWYNEYYKTPEFKQKAAEARARRKLAKQGAVVPKVELGHFLSIATHCYWCNQELDRDTPRAIAIDHVIPLALGGKHSKENLVVACSRCNSVKGALMPDDFIRKFGTRLNIDKTKHMAIMNKVSNEVF